MVVGVSQSKITGPGGSTEPLHFIDIEMETRTGCEGPVCEDWEPQGPAWPAQAGPCSPSKPFCSAGHGNGWPLGLLGANGVGILVTSMGSAPRYVLPGENWIFPPGGSTNFEPLQGLPW